MKKNCKRIALAMAALLLCTCLCGCGAGQTKDRECVAIIAALSFEVELIRDELTDMKESTLLGTPVYTGTLGGSGVVVMQCGMGKVSAGIGTQALIDEYHPDCVINTGCAGALDESLAIGDTVLSDAVSEWDLDLKAIGYPQGYIDALGCVEMEASKELADRIAAAVPEKQKVVRGLVVSGDQFVSTNEQRALIREYFPKALCAEMEGAAVGHVCVQNDVPFCIVRAMSDTADGDSGVDYAEFSVEASKKSAAWLVAMLKG